MQDQVDTPLVLVRHSERMREKTLATVLRVLVVELLKNSVILAAEPDEAAFWPTVAMVTQSLRAVWLAVRRVPVQSDWTRERLSWKVMCTAEAASPSTSVSRRLESNGMEPTRALEDSSAKEKAPEVEILKAPPVERP